MTDTYTLSLLNSFDAEQATYAAFTKNVGQLVESLLTEAEIDHLPIEARTKARKSFEEKIRRPEKAEKYTRLDVMTDLSGVRIIAFLKEDCERIAQLVQENFEVDFRNSINKEELSDPDRFGYLSIHYVVSHNAVRSKLPEFKRFSGLKAEIQIRTILQHAWADIDKKLRYKRAEDAPKAVRRKLYRISALLEAADEDFSQVSEQIIDIREGYERDIAAGAENVNIDLESVDVFLRSNPIVQAIAISAQANGFSVSPPHPAARNPLSSLVSSLLIARIHRIEEFDQLLQKHEAQIDGALKSVFNSWNVPPMHGSLVLNISNIVRLVVVLFCSDKAAKAILTAVPFGPTLQLAIQNVRAELTGATGNN